MRRSVCKSNCLQQIHFRLRPLQSVVKSSKQQKTLRCKVQPGVTSKERRLGKIANQGVRIDTSTLDLRTKAKVALRNAHPCPKHRVWWSSISSLACKNKTQKIQIHHSISSRDSIKKLNCHLLSSIGHQLRLWTWNSNDANNGAMKPKSCCKSRIQSSTRFASQGTTSMTKKSLSSSFVATMTN